MSQQLTIQKVPEVLKLARQKAALGSYPEAIRSYRRALQTIAEHTKALGDPFLRQQWKATDNELRDEIEAIYKLHKSLKTLRGEGDTGAGKDQGQGREERAVFKGSELEKPKPPPSVVERFGGQPFAGKVHQEPARVESHPVSNEPKKDPMVWDPPSPKYQQRKAPVQKKLPKWAHQPRAGQKQYNKPSAYSNIQT